MLWTRKENFIVFSQKYNMNFVKDIPQNKKLNKIKQKFFKI